MLTKVVPPSGTGKLKQQQLGNSKQKQGNPTEHYSLNKFSVATNKHPGQSDR